MTQVWGYQFQGQELRVVGIQTDTLRFVLEDVCNILELDVYSVVSRLHISDINRTGIQDEHGFQGVSLVSVAGLYQVIALAEKKIADPFQRWVNKLIEQEHRRARPPGIYPEHITPLLYIIAWLALALYMCAGYIGEDFWRIIGVSVLPVWSFGLLRYISCNPPRRDVGKWVSVAIQCGLIGLLFRALVLK